MLLVLLVLLVLVIWCAHLLQEELGRRGQAIECDDSLAKWEQYADTEQKGFLWDGLLLNKNYVDSLGNNHSVLVATSQF